MSPKVRNQLISLIAVVIGMVMLTYASVPLYRLFCQVTGFGGTTARATSQSVKLTDRYVTVRFNADVDPSMPWEFKAPPPIRVKVGANTLVAFTAENQSDEPIRGMATYNVTPHEMGPYFEKIQCFCFETQLLNPHEKVNMPVSFYLDPEMLTNFETKNLKEVTLSYTFFIRKES